jgi:hypothetical protein
VSTRFDNVSDGADRTTNLPIFPWFTIMGFFRPRADTGSAANPIVMLGASSGDAYHEMGIDWLASPAVMTLWTGAGPVVGTRPIDLNRWYHGALVCKGSGATDVSVYLDAQLEIVSASNLVTAHQALRFTGNNFTDLFNGALENWLILNYAASQQEILAHSQGRFPHVPRYLVNSWYRMRGLWDLAEDYSGHGRRLTLAGTPANEDLAPVPWNARVRRSFFKPTSGTLFTKDLVEVVSMADSGPLTTGKLAAEAIALVDTRSLATVKQALEAVALVDSRLFASARSLSDAMVLVDTLVKKPGKVLADPVVLADTVATILVLVKTLSEAVALVDTVSRGSGKVLGEVLLLQEAMLRSLARSLAEALGLVDTRSLATAKSPLLEALALSDVLARGAAKTLGEAVTLQEPPAGRLTGKPLAEVVGLADDLSRSLARALSETVSLADLVTAINGAITLGTIASALAVHLGPSRVAKPLQAVLGARPLSVHEARRQED